MRVDLVIQYARELIDHLLDSQTYPAKYEGPLRDRVVALQEALNAQAPKKPTCARCSAKRSFKIYLHAEKQWICQHRRQCNERIRATRKEKECIGALTEQQRQHHKRPRRR